jgi:DNA-binding transcriptional MerR regulator
MYLKGDKVKEAVSKKEEAGRWYQATEFARITGVTVRTLHHYDRVGLLRPARTSAGYRHYSAQDFVRLQQIVTLKFIGFSLNQIKDLLDTRPLDLRSALRLQREVIARRRDEMDRAVKAIEEAERALSKSGVLDERLFAKVCEVINMQNNWEWVKKYYTEEQLRNLASRWSPELQQRAERDWATLINDVEAAVTEGVSPESERARDLADRWAALINEFTGGDLGIAENLKKLYADQSNWPATAQKPYSDDVGAFIFRTEQLRDKK